MLPDLNAFTHQFGGDVNSSERRYLVYLEERKGP
jgi:hypothetical protein